MSRSRYDNKRVLVPFLLFFVLVHVSPLFAETIQPSTTSRQAREESIRAIPFREMNEASRTKLGNVVSHATLYRRLPVETVDCDPKMYLFLVRHPEVVIDIWKIMGATEMSARRTAEFELACNDGLGTRSTVELVYGTPDLHVMYAEGEYEGSMWPRKIQGRAVILLRSAYRQQADGGVSVANQLDIFVQVDNGAANIIARSLHPLMGRTADNNFIQSVTFLTRISQTSEDNGPGMARLSDRLDQVAPQIRNEFSNLAMDVWEEAEARETSARTHATPASYPQR